MWSYLCLPAGVRLPSSPSHLLGLIAAALLAAGCATGSADESDPRESESAQVAASVVVADSKAVAAADVAADRVTLPSIVADRYRVLQPGAIFVGARAGTKTKNPDGFLRRVVSVADEGGALVVHTTNATLTDAIVRGAVRASSGSNGIDGELTAAPSTVRPQSREELTAIAIDFSDKPLFEGTDEIDVAGGKAKFTESIRFDRAVLTSKPVVDVDLAIRDGAVSRFVAKVAGNLDTSVKARAVVTAEGDVNEATLAELKTRKKDVERVIYQSPRVALPTFAVGGVPVSPSVQFTVKLRCSLAFGGPLSAEAGLEAKSSVRLGAVFEGGAWQPPIKSDFDIKPEFTMTQGGEIDARCAIEADAQLFAYGASGVTLTVAPYVDFGVKHEAGGHHFRVQGGATGHLRGNADVFGVTIPESTTPLAEWNAPSLLEGTVASP